MILSKREGARRGGKGRGGIVRERERDREREEGGEEKKKKGA
jgi:hypothetical protein